MPPLPPSSKCAPALLLAAGLCGDRATWAPETDEVVEWSWRVEQRLELDDMYFEPLSSHGHRTRMPYSNYALEVCDRIDLRVRDRVLERDEERVRELERSFVVARRQTATELQYANELEEEKLVTTSRLEEHSVHYRWSDDKDEVRAVAAGKEPLDEDWLGGLDEELDLRGILDGETRELGDRWLIGEAAIWRLLRPGGDLVLRQDEHESTESTGTADLGWLLSTSLLNRETYAHGRARYARVETAAGRRFARIDLDIRLETEGDVRESVLELSEDRLGAKRWADLTTQIDLEHDLRLRGELYWDLEAHRAESLELEGRTEVRLEVWVDFAAYGWEGIAWILTAELRGDLRIEVRSSRLEDED